MQKKLTEYVRYLFRNAADTQKNRDLEEEILQNTLDRYEDLVAGGVSPEHAYAQAIANLGDVESLLEQKAAPDYQPQTGKTKHSRRTGWIILAVALGLLLLVIIGALVLFGLNFTAHQSGGFGRYEEPENVIENRIDSVEETVENWAEGVENQIENAVKDAIEGGIASFSYHYADEDRFSIGAAEVETRNVNRLVIDWVSGQVTVEPYEGDTIFIRESEQEKEKNQLRWRQEGETLTIRYCASTGDATAANKDLTVLLPMDLAAHLNYVQIDTVSAEASVSGLTAGELQFDSTSGSLQASGIFRLLDVDTTSGGMNFSGETMDVELDTVSGDFVMNCSETPRELSFDSTSGDLELAVPDRRSFEASFDTVSGDFHNDFGALQFRDDEIYYEGTERGEEAELEFDTVSGDVRIEKTAADKVPAT